LGEGGADLGEDGVDLAMELGDFFGDVEEEGERVETEACGAKNLFHTISIVLYFSARVSTKKDSEVLTIDAPCAAIPPSSWIQWIIRNPIAFALDISGSSACAA
jgi:hypothetical protein